MLMVLGLWAHAGVRTESDSLASGTEAGGHLPFIFLTLAATQRGLSMEDN